MLFDFKSLKRIKEFSVKNYNNSINFIKYISHNK